MLVLPAGLERVTVAPLEARVLVTVLVVSPFGVTSSEFPWM